MQETTTGGGVVVGQDGRVVVVNQNGNSWSLPKGHVDPGETKLQAAIREIKEEAGIGQLELIKELGSYDRYRIGIDGSEETKETKHITMFLFKTNQTTLAPEDPDNPEARWVEPEKVAALLTHQKDKDFFTSVIQEVKQLLPE